MAADPVPSPCRVVRRRAARRLTLRVSRAGARLTVPPRTGAREIEAFLRDSAGWVPDQWARLGPPPTPLAGGDRLALLDDELELVLAPDGRRATVRRDGRRLVASTGAGAGLDAAVERWYRREAQPRRSAGSRGPRAPTRSRSPATVWCRRPPSMARTSSRRRAIPVIGGAPGQIPGHQAGRHLEQARAPVWTMILFGEGERPRSVRIDSSNSDHPRYA